VGAAQHKLPVEQEAIQVLAPFFQPLLQQAVVGAAQVQQVIMMDLRAVAEAAQLIQAQAVRETRQTQHHRRVIMAAVSPADRFMAALVAAVQVRWGVP
jgi:hypothetical protein